MVKLFTTCQACGELLRVAGHPGDPHPGCVDVDYVTRLRTDFLAAVAAGDDRRADALARTVDIATSAPQSLTGAALWYAARGWPVFPLRPGGKTPATRRGFHESSTDADQIRAWWSASPESNIGLPTGHRFDAIDVDYRIHPVALQIWADIRGGYEIHGMVSTPRGMHYYTRPSGDSNASGSLGIAGLDYRGKGGYVVAPPSRRADGNYAWWSPPSPEL